MFCLLHIAAA